MSRYEMLGYENLLQRVGITPNETWFCGNNQSEKPVYNQTGATYNQPGGGYGGSMQHHAVLCLSEDINVNGLLLNHRDPNGTIWLCTGIEGWWTTSTPEIPDVPAPFWDGSMLTTGRYTARTITISGCFIPPDPSLVWYNRDALIRAGSIVRGIGLLAMCGNESPVIHAGDPFYDPAKMAVIQSADVPLIDTIRADGFTQFSLSFRCPSPIKLSIKEQSTTLDISEDDTTMNRRYLAFSKPFDAADAGDVITTYSQLYTKADLTASRKYSDVKKVNSSSLISNEELLDPSATDMNAYEVAGGGTGLPTFPSTVVHNSGNYFAFPIFVFDRIDGTDGVADVLVQNLTTDESMRIRKTVPAGQQLVVDSGQRRVVLLTNPSDNPANWTWDDRDALTLTSEWINLAPGDNKIYVTTGAGTSFPSDLPKIYWRDTWIG